jgi:hypothetical protein
VAILWISLGIALACGAKWLADITRSSVAGDWQWRHSTEAPALQRGAPAYCSLIAI